MGQVTFADLIARRVPLAASEAAALTLAVARVMDGRRAAGQCVQLPDDEWILLSSSGEVSIVEVHASHTVDETAALSALLRRLLRLDERLPASGQIVPGGLLIVLARNLGYIHLPATAPDAFRAALERFAAANPAVLAAVFWRAAATRPARTSHAAGGGSTGARHRAERRSRGASRADLRRTIRELELELFAARTSGEPRGTVARRMSHPLVRGAAAAVLAICFVVAIAVGSLAVPGRASEQTVSSRPDIVLPPTRTPAAAVLRPATHRVSDAPPAPAPRASSSPPRGTANRRGRQVPAVARTRDTETRRARPATDPLAAHRGGTRGIPFTLPSR